MSYWPTKGQGGNQTTVFYFHDKWEVIISCMCMWQGEHSYKCLIKVRLYPDKPSPPQNT